jgi:hypothetical protein
LGYECLISRSMILTKSERKATNRKAAFNNVPTCCMQMKSSETNPDSKAKTYPVPE